MKSSSIRKKTLALLLMLCMALFALPAFAQEFTVTKTVDLAQELPGTNDERFSAYLEQELYAPIYGDISLFGTSAGNALSAQHKLMYDALKARIEKVANGTSTSTVFTIDPSTIAGLQRTFTAAELGVSDIVVGSSISSAAGSAAIGKFFGNNDELFNALLHDCPLELYWFDKAVADAMGIQASFSSDGVTLTVTSLTVTMQVAKSYQNGSSTKVKAANISSVVSAAQAIVDKYAGKSDKEKLEGYRDEICALTSYNDEAAENTSTPYGDPWQMIYVFDGNPSTTVVCEGYSKSFQYLCDLSSFNNVECYTVSGMMGSEPHMWNIVVMDGVSYLVDVTNSDAGSVGQNGGLFLTNTPAEGNVDTGYLFLVSGQGVHYDYDNESVDLWGKDLLTLGGEAEHVCSFTGEATYRVVDDVQHEAVVHCIGCEKTKTFTENHTISSEATCSSSAFCDLCQVYFGDIDDTNHESNEFYYTVNTFNKLKHDKRHVCCQLIVETTSHEETTPANCQSPAYCAVCDSSYGSKAPNTHALSTYKYVVNSSNPEKHDKVYDCCGKAVETTAHNYSAATCQAPATCADCGHTTGDKGDHVMDANGKCTACGTEAAAKFTDAYGTVTYYTDYIDLQSAIYNHGAGTITLLKDQTEENSNGTLHLSSGSETTLDINGRTLAYYLVIDKETNVLIKDSVGNGKPKHCIYIYSGILKIDASFDCLSVGDGDETLMISNNTGAELSVGTDVILPEGILLLGKTHYVVDSIPNEESARCHKHNWETEWFTNDKKHWHGCEGCKTAIDEADHIGGTATCTDLAKCSVCGEAYGSVNPNAHSCTYNVTGGTIVETCANGCTHHAEAALMPPANLVYDGTAKSATIEDKFSGRLNLTITYSTADGSAPVAPGKYTASIKVGDKTASIEFEIAAAALNAEVTLSPETVTYNGSEQKPAVTVAGLTEGKDYTVTFPADMTNAGIKTITVTGMGNYSGVATKTFTIEKATLTAADFIFTAPADPTYDGKAKTAAVTTAKTDAAVTVKYSADPVNVGTYTVSIDVAESANYKAASLTDASWTFSIAPKTVTTPTFFGLEALYLHTGSAIEPTFTLKDGETEIPASEYTVAYSNNVNVGTATVTVSDVAGGNYTVSGTATFAIATHEHVWSYTASGNVITATCSGDLGSCPNKTVTLTVTAASSVYDGAAKTAAVTVDPAGALAAPAITYSTADGSAPFNAGTYDASITLGDATAKTSFTIEKAELTAADFFFTAPANLVYDGNTKIAKVVCTKTDCVITVKYNADPVNVGTYTVSIDAAQSKNYNNASLSSEDWTFAITPASIASATVTAAEQVYTGEEIKPAVTVTLGGKTLLEGTDFTVAYSDNVNVGSAKITVTGKGNYEGTANGTFEIKTSGSALTANADKTAYTYGEQIIVTAKAELSQQKRSLFALRAVTPTMALYYGDTKLDEAEVVNGEANLSYMTAGRAFAPADKIELTVRYSGDANMAESETTVSFSMSKKTLTPGLGGSVTKVYDGETTISSADDLFFSVSGTMKGDIPMVKASSFAFADANVGENKAVTASGYTLDETSAKYYALGATEATANVGKITPASIASATVTADEQVYTGAELKPAVTVTLGGKTLLEGTDFTAAYSDNVNVGSAKITVTGKGNYEGTANGTFEIKTSGSALTANADKTAYTYGEQIIVTAKAELSQQKRSLFALRAVTPTMALYYGDTKLDEAEVVNGEANLSYMTAGRAFAPADKIELTVRYSGDANMAESETTVSFSMSKKTLTPGLGGSVTKVYDGETTISSADDLFFSVSGTMKGDIPMVKASSFAFADANVGENKAVTASGYTLDETSAKYYALGATEATANVGKITPASIASATVKADNQVYTGAELKPAVTVTLGGKTLLEGTDFTVAYSDNVNVGTAKITVTGKGNYEGTANGTFEIGKARPVTEAPAGLTAVYGDLLSTVALPDHDLGTWNWVNPDVEVGNAGVQTHEVIFVPFDAEQYISVTLSAKVTVTKADMTFGDSFKVLLGDTENTAFTYGDIVTVKAQPRMETPVLMALRAFTAPKANQMALFSGSTQISEAVDPDADGVYTMTYDTSDKALAAGSNTITAKYVGTENLNDFSASAAITIAKRELTITSVKANNRVHKAGNTKVTVTGAEFDGKLSGDDVNIATVKGDVGSDAIGTYTTVTLPELTLIGSDASFYVLKPTDSAATNVEIVAVPADLPVEPELDSFDDTDISDELKDAGFDSTDDITTALKENLDKQLKEDEALNPVPGAQPKEILGTETHNVGIVYNEDGEKIEGDSEHFPQSGMTVLLPIPEGTAPDTHEYYGAFMTGSTNGDQLAGSVVPLTVEVVTGENGEQMLSVEIPAIGQIMIGWVAKAVDLPETGDASNILLWLAMLAISCPAMLFTSKKMKRSMR